jgi:aminoglycoside phosphotransferase family enzyme/predicted kinase
VRHVNVRESVINDVGVQQYNLAYPVQPGSIFKRNPEVFDGEFDDIVQLLSRPSAYPHRPERVEIVETHISVVFLAGEFAYKLKRRVRYDFLDFTSAAKREAACRDEVRLDRRLTDDVYLGVVPITRRPDGGLVLGGEGPAVDWLVQMRRLPTEETLDALHRRGQLRDEHVRQLAGRLAEFYGGLSPLAIEPAEYRQRYESHIRGNLSELLAVSHHCPRNQVRRIHGFQLQLLHLQPQLFDERVCRGRIVEGHGDLRPEHICFTQPLAIFDCIEFSADFRRIDMADELAFLAAECDFLGARWVGPRLFELFQPLTGDRPPQELVAFYKSYRACVRAKVAALRADQLSGKDRDAAAAEALAHLNLADSYLQPWSRPILLAVGGLSGTGKTTLAAQLTERLGGELLRTDVIRRELLPGARDPVAFNSGNYTAELRRRVYLEMLRRAEALTADGVSVALDGTFSSAEAIVAAKQVADESNAIFLAIECHCRPEVARQRMARRQSAGSDASEARPEFHERQHMAWESWPDWMPQIQIDTESTLAAQTQAVVAELRRRNRR